MQKITCWMAAGLLAASTDAIGQDQVARVEEVQVWGQQEASTRDNTGPTSVLLPSDFAAINVATTEDLVKYEPSLVIRRRFIGDANGTLGIRGSNMFQTARSMVFADGVPLHYFLQSRWNGAPRWTLVSASEIAQVEVIYGPFSAEYSGNAMGGVVLIETAIPQERQIHVDTSYFTQNFSDYGFDGSVAGHKVFVSYGDRFDDLSVYLSYNRLENESQPQTFYYGLRTSDAEVPDGALPGRDAQGQEAWFYGDSGVVDTATDNFKVKLGYEFGQWAALLNLSYEDRAGFANSPNAYVTGPEGEAIWGGTVETGGQAYPVSPTAFGLSEQDRQSLSASLRINGDLSDRAQLVANFSQFEILEDEARRSASHPSYPDFDGAGQITAYDDTGWKTADVKLRLSELGSGQIRIDSGLRVESYELNALIFNSLDYQSGSRDELSDSSGGKTGLVAAFTQLHWNFAERWDTTIGARWESWKSWDGHFLADESDIGAVPERSLDRVSPKFSIGFQPEAWTLRYSFAQAYRFPIVEELFSQYKTYSAVGAASPHLKPEDGLHHNLLIERALTSGYARLNLFAETIEDVIESQATFLPSDPSITVRTFIPIDEVETRGAELVLNAEEILQSRWDVRFNLAYIKSEISQNSADTRIEGNDFPRMPRWRGNVLATFRWSDNWDLGASIQYADDSFGRLDNTDLERRVYGAQDGYTRLGIRSNHRLTPQLRLSLGVDNLTNHVAYVAHPWPGRTLYGSLALEL